MLAAAVLAVAAGAYYWVSRPRDLDTITADYSARAEKLAAQLDRADGYRALSILKELGTYGGLAEPAVPSILQYIERLELENEGNLLSPFDAYKALRDIGDLRFIPIFMRVVENENAPRRTLLASWGLLGQMGAVEVVEPMLRVVSESIGDDVSVEARTAIQYIGRRHPEAILAAVTHPDRAIRRATVSTMRRARFDPDATEWLIDEAFTLLEDANPPVRIDLESLLVNLSENVEDARIDDSMRDRAALEAHVWYQFKMNADKGIERSEQTIRDAAANRRPPRLEEDLQDAAIEASDDPAAIRFYLNDDSSTIYYPAARALAEHANRASAVRELRLLLDHKNIWYVKECIGHLASLQAVEAVDDLLRLAEKEPARNLTTILEALAEIGDARAVPLFLEQLNYPNTAKTAAEGLIRVTGTTHQALLEDLTSSSSSLMPHEKISILLLLEQLDGRSRERDIFRLIEQSDVSQIQFIPTVLRESLEEEEGNARLLRMLRDRRDAVAHLAVTPLVSKFGDEALPILRARIPSAGDKTILEIIRQLRWINSPEAVDVLIFIMEQRNPPYYPYFSLFLITGENYGQIAEAWRAWYREQQ